jgi:sulfatase maturation enzyme AslB (radical SAM superfamily)
MNMIADKPSTPCKRCYELENDAGAYTLRKNMNNKFGHHFSKVLNTQQDGYHENVNFVYMDLRFSNLCNLSCRTCGPTFSTSWYDDYIKAYGVVNTDEAEQKYIQLKNNPNFLEELWPLLDNVEDVNWAGGEPLVTAEHWDIMNYWISTGKAKEITINYTTNFTNLIFKKQNILELWKHFKSVNVAASLDASYSRGEYIRKGTIWENIVDNRRKMLKEVPNVYFEITPTVSLMNILHLPDFHREWLELGLLQDPTHFRINNLLGPDYFSTKVLPMKYKEEVAAKWSKHLDYLKQNYKTDLSKNDWLASAKGLIDSMLKEDRTYLLPRTKEVLQHWDRIRKEKWQDFLPELKFLEEV